MTAPAENIAIAARVLALGLSNRELVAGYLGDDAEAVELALALAEREPSSLQDADAGKLTSIARNLLTLGLSDRDTLAAGLAGHEEADAIAETALALAGMSAHRAPEPEPQTPLEIARQTPARYRSPEQRQLVADADARIMEAAAKAMNVTLDASGRPISAAACTAGRHVFGPEDHRGWSTCSVCGVVSVVSRQNRGAVDPHAHDHASEATVQTYETGRVFNSRSA